MKKNLRARLSALEEKTKGGDPDPVAVTITRRIVDRAGDGLAVVRTERRSFQLYPNRWAK